MVLSAHVAAEDAHFPVVALQVLPCAHWPSDAHEVVHAVVALSQV